MSSNISDVGLSDDLLQSISSELTCPICFTFMSEPHTLLCGHTFCGECLQKLTPHSNKKRNCPICRSPFSHSGVNIALRAVFILLKRNGLSQNVDENEFTRLVNKSNIFTLDETTDSSSTSSDEEKQDHQLCDSYTFGLASWYVEGQPLVEPVVLHRETASNSGQLNCRDEVNDEAFSNHQVWDELVNKISLQTRNSYTCGLATEFEEEICYHEKDLPEKKRKKNARKLTKLLKRLVENQQSRKQKRPNMNEEKEHEDEGNQYTYRKTYSSYGCWESQVREEKSDDILYDDAMMYDEQICDSYTFGLVSDYEQRGSRE